MRRRTGLQLGAAIWLCSSGLAPMVAGYIPAPVDRAARSPWYVALGGSNTCGHHVPIPRIFFSLIGSGLQKRGLVNGSLNKCLPAMGPDFSATCLDAMLPRGIRFATVEFLPNMLIRLTEQQLAFESIVSTLLSRGVATVIVDVLPVIRRKRQRTLIAQVHSNIIAFAARVNAPLISVVELNQSTLFRSHHLNEDGHKLVAKFAIRELGSRLLAGGGLAAQAASPGAATCAVGTALSSSVVRADGFAPVDIAQAGSADRSTPKVVWQAVSAGARLVLCADGLATMGGEGMIMLGLQRTHAGNTPLVGVARIGCAGCKCTRAPVAPAPALECGVDDEGAAAVGCAVDLLHAAQTTETVFEPLLATMPRRRSGGAGNRSSSAGQEPTREPPRSCACEVHVRPAPNLSRNRILVRALVVTRVNTSYGVARSITALANKRQSHLEVRRRRLRMRVSAIAGDEA